MLNYQKVIWYATSIAKSLGLLFGIVDVPSLRTKIGDELRRLFLAPVAVRCPLWLKKKQINPVNSG